MIAGPHPADAAAIAPRYELPATFDGIAGMRLALCIRPDDWPVDDDVAAAIRDAAAPLEACGATVEEVAMPGFGPAQTMQIADAHYGQIMGRVDCARDGAPRPAVRVHHRGLRGVRAT